MYDKNPKLQYDELPKDKIIRPRRMLTRREKIIRYTLAILIMILAIIYPILFPDARWIITDFLMYQ